MNDEEKKKLSDEVDSVIESRIEFINRHYLGIRDAYQNSYEWPELDPLRDEICICIMFGLCQAAIALTNHLLESMLKYALIVSDGRELEDGGGISSKSAISYLQKKYTRGFERYGYANLDKTINRACSVGLITKRDKEKLHDFRIKFRNAYGHADKSKTFGDMTAPTSGIKLDSGKIVQGERGTPEVAGFIIFQGLIQAEKAQSDAPPYFLFIDRLVRSIREKIFVD